jgi:hypothetical protein
MVHVPLSSPLQVNITYFFLDENEIQWHPSTDIIFIEDAIHIDIGLSFKIFTQYQTNSRFILPNASMNATIQNFRIITDVGFNLINENLYPDFKTLNVTLEKLEIFSSTLRINYLTHFFSGLIKSLSSSQITSTVHSIVPETVSNILRSEIKIKNMGTFEPKFLKVPEISSYGMLVDMTMVKIN